MNSEFSIRLSGLRKEKNISQKEAAGNLGVSQALLSHYEKGIRECGLDFLTKAADYYDVTTDYLLGRTDNRNGYYDIYNENDIETDKSLNSSTVFRCLVHTVNELTNISSESQDKIRKFLMLTSYRLRIYSVSQGLTDKSRFSLDINYADKLASDIQSDLLSCDYNTKPQDIPKDKTFTKTIIKESEKFIKQEIQNKLKKQKQQ